MEGKNINVLEVTQKATGPKKVAAMNADSQNSLQIGEVLSGKWVILEFLAKGGMGEVYRAHQIHLKRDVAIKVISKEWLDSISDDTEEREIGLQRFRNEVQAMARVRHPNVLQIYDYGTLKVQKDDEEVTLEYIAMEYIAGGTLRATMSEEGFEDEEDLVRDWLKSYFFLVLEGVSAIHELKMAHRDLKPANVLMEGETPKIADFGLAHSYEWKPVTQSVDVKGTPAYMSPEHFFEFGKADHLSDIYSLGKILFEAIDGKISSKSVPFKMASLSEAETPLFKKLDRVIRTATAEKRSKRYPSVAVFRQAIQEALEDEPAEAPQKDAPGAPQISLWQKPWLIWGGIGLAVILVAAMGLWHLLYEPDSVQTDTETVAVVVQPAPTAIEAETRPTEATVSSLPAVSLLGRDGIRMDLVPAGEFGPVGEAASAESSLAIPSFYLDEKNVTNYNFVEFLNTLKDKLTIENGVVKRKAQIWFYLGQGTAPYEQIIYEHNRFHLRDTNFAANPVVRVTWYGAAAYAAHFGKRLPTERERRYAASLDQKQHQKSTSAATDHEGASQPASQPELHASHMASLTEKEAASHAKNPATPGKPGATAGVVKEWILQTGDASLKKASNGNLKDSAYASAVIPQGFGAEAGPAEFRYPWEGFADVGFRCVMDTVKP
jgi:eukaryotic-like serine/threonine-protein kinase